MWGKVVVFSWEIEVIVVGEVSGQVKWLGVGSGGEVCIGRLLVRYWLAWQRGTMKLSWSSI